MVSGLLGDIGYRARGCVALALAIFVVVAATAPGPAQSQGLLPSNVSGAPTADSSQLQLYDPAAAMFNAQQSEGAMSSIAPIVFGDFLSATALKFTSGFSGPMGLAAAVDPAVSTTLNQTFQQTLVSAGGPAEAEQFSVGPSDVALPQTAPSADPAAAPDAFLGLVGYSATAGDLPSLSLDDTSVKTPSPCPDSETARDLQTSSRFWGPQTRSAVPVEFPNGIVSGRNISDPLGDLGPTGDRPNLSPVGPAGSWCRPGPTPFDLTSPLENRLVLLLFGLLAGGLLVFYLTRGVSLPA